ncbi:hypothetical protein BACCIP111883_03271 [Sutcliffiella rhizosphaerae]|uniref:Guanylate kinase-like domain-containing protein n=1 Tax=Sutcliffiella rhizosphaerae TaxID=2880967 RepID=A0ABN8AI19_9BACI|nr:hypothetical protein BACCIP111883_03271 [Sutcliffiella rhizosphaerae]
MPFNTEDHLIICNSNRTKHARSHVLDTFFPMKNFFRVLVYFDVPEDTLLERVKSSNRNTNIFRGDTNNFEALLKRQQLENEDVSTEEEADYLFLVRDNIEMNHVIDDIVHLAQ